MTYFFTANFRSEKNMDVDFEKALDELAKKYGMERLSSGIQHLEKFINYIPKEE
jgi:hypothetical protein